MICRPITIINKLGLHARATNKLVTTASRFDSKITLKAKGREVDARNIMQVMMLAAKAPKWSWPPMARTNRKPLTPWLH